MVFRPLLLLQQIYSKISPFDLRSEIHAGHTIQCEFVKITIWDRLNKYRETGLSQVGEAKKSRYATGNPLYTFANSGSGGTGHAVQTNLGGLSSRSALASGGIVCFGG